MSQRVIFWITSFTTCVVLSKKIHHVSNFESKALQSVKILFHEVQKESVFELKTTKRVKLRKKLYSNVHVNHFVPQNWHVLPSSCFFKGILLKKTVCIVSELSWTKSKPVRFCFKSFTTCKILKWKIYHLSSFNLKVSARIIIWNKTNRIFQAVK